MKNEVILAFLIPVVIASGCLGAPPKETNMVNIQNNAFDPAEITVAKGTTVTWTNMDNVDHTVTGSGLLSEDIRIGKPWSHTFNEAGTFDYICSIHTSMRGKVIVKG